MKWADALNAFLLNLIKQAAQIIIDVALQPDNVEKYKMSYRQIWQTGAVNAPKSGKADEDSKKQEASANLPTDMPLPDKW